MSAKQHGLLFTEAMIRAFLRTQHPKRQTRRLPTAANSLVDGYGVSAKRWAEMKFDWSTAFVDGGPSPAGNPGPYLHIKRGDSTDDELWARIYPRIQPGDTLYAREGTWERPERSERDMREGADTWEPFAYDADCIFDDDKPTLKAQGWKHRNSIHMPRRAARIVRTVASVRAERLQDISEADAMQEGLTQLSKDGGQTWKWGIPDRDGWPGNDDIGWPWQLWEQSPYEAYRALWMGLHGVASWQTNPIVWVYDLAPVSEAA